MYPSLLVFLLEVFLLTRIKQHNLPYSSFNYQAEEKDEETHPNLNNDNII